MNAKQARDLTEKQRKGPVIQLLLDYVHAQIQIAAESGRDEVPQIVVKDKLFPDSWPRDQALDALHSALRKEGFIVTHHPEPDPGHPCSRPYTSISW